MSDLHQPGTVIIFPRRKVESNSGNALRSAQPPVIRSASARIDGAVKLSKLLHGLSVAGLAFRHDRRTGEFVILPDPEART